MTPNNIAKTIQQQMLMVGMPIIMSWGTTNYQSMSEEKLKSFEITGMGALKFKVNGMKFKGHVLVVLNFIDTYDVYFGNIRKDIFKITKIMNDVYCEELGQVIDNYIEKQANYQF